FFLLLFYFGSANTGLSWLVLYRNISVITLFIRLFIKKRDISFKLWPVTNNFSVNRKNSINTRYIIIDKNLPSE
ncbi:MAG: hypothetical protein JXR90_03495, partial [Spirochaetes bacterium]|nr:hypothetical protein [Spirochaetota bacterium]